MPQRKPITDAERVRVVELHNAGWSRAAIARDLGRAPSTVGKIAAAAGVDFDRTRTEQATAAKQADNRAKRADLESLLLDDALELRKRLWQPARVYAFGGKENDYNEAWLDEPPFADKRQIMQTAGTAVDKAIKIAAVDADNGADEAKSMLGGIAALINQANEQQGDGNGGDG